jgi:spore coat polysaccharide biosynthesis protein SpsF
VARAQSDRLPPGRRDRPHVIVSMGVECEPMTLPCVKALARLESSFDATVVIGLGAPRELEGQIARHAPRFSIVRSGECLPALMPGADLALIGFGGGAYELAALGVPALYICTRDQQALAASAFERAGMGYSLVGMTPGAEAKIAGAVTDLLGDAAHRRAMSAAGRMNLDGRGGERIAARLKQMVEARAEALADIPAVRLAAAG